MLATARDRGGFFKLPRRTILALSGADRERYLNGQVTNDVRKLAPGHALSACVVSAKGKLDGVVVIWSDETRLLVEVDSTLAESMAARLDRYLVADDVEITELEGSETEYHAFGPAAERLAAAGVGLRRVDRLAAAGIDFAESDLKELTNWTELEAAELEVLRIERKIPRWGAELSPDTLPAEAGLDRTAVDFHKGCYIGQEVISRIQSVGRTNRTLVSFVVTEGEAPEIGSELFAEDDSAKAVGMVTSVASHFELARPVGLCYIKRGREGSFVTGSGTRVNLCELPCE